MPGRTDEPLPAGAPALGPWQRLRQRAQFNAVLNAPPVAKTPHFALHALCPAQTPGTSLFDGAGPWLGTLLPKRWAKRAVTRNALRRQIYAVSRELSGAWPDRALVVRLRAGWSPAQFVSATSPALKQAARAELLRLFAGGRHA